jgi:RNA polymerase sigma factor (sigma-70 family)
MRDARLGPVLRHLRRLTLPTVAQGHSDVQLLERFCHGHEEAAFATLMQRHGGLVWGVCRHVLRHEQDAEDAFQATFLVLAQQARGIRRAEALSSWLHGTAFRIAMRAKRDAGRRRNREARAELSRPAPTSSESAWQELQAALDQEVQALPQRQRAVFVLCVLEGKSQAEAADALGWGSRAVSGTLARARQRLRARLAARGITLSAVLAGLAVAGRQAGAAPGHVVDAALRFVLASPGSVAIPAHVSALVRSASREVISMKLKVLAALLLVASAVGLGAAVLPAPPVTPPEPAAEPVAFVAAGERAPPDEDAALAESPLPAGALARLGTSRFRHAHIVSAIVYSPDGKWIITGSHLGTVRFWDPVSGKEERVFSAHDGGVCGLAISPDGKLLATGSWDRNLRVWDIATGQQLHTLTGHSSEVSRLTFSPNGKVLVSGSKDGTARLWDPVSGQQLSTIPAHDGEVRGVAFSADGKRLATSGTDKKVHIWDVESGKQLLTCEGHGNSVESVVFSPDGKTVASCSRDATARLWDSTSGKETRSLKHDSWLERVVFSPDGKLLAVAGGWGGKVHLWDLTTGVDRPRWTGRQPQSISVAFSPDGKKLAGAGWEAAVRVWDVATGKEEGAASAGGHTGWVYAVAVLPDRKTLVSTGSDGTIIVWDMAKGREQRRMEANKDRVHCLAASPDGKTVATGGRDRTIHLWDVPSGKEISKITAGGCVHALAFSPNGRHLASASGNDVYDGWVLEIPGHGAAVWDVATGQEVCRLDGHEGGVKCVAYSPDGKTIATCGNDKTIRLWDAATGKPLRQLDGHTGAVESVAFSPDGKRLASAGQDGVARLWRLGGEQPPVLLGEPNGYLLSVAFSPDGRTLLVASRDPTKLKFALRLWDVATGQERARLPGNQFTAAAVAFSPDGRVIVSGGGDASIVLWDVTGRVARGQFAMADLSPPALEGEWTDLAAEDGFKAQRALWALVAAPKQTLPLLRSFLKPVPVGDAERIARLIKELDADEFDVRDKASAELDQIGEPAAPGLRKALEGMPSAELRIRATTLLEKFGGKVQSPDIIRRERALEVLEQIGGPDARTLLEELAKGAPDAMLTREAKAILKRLAR